MLSDEKFLISAKTGYIDRRQMLKCLIAGATSLQVAPRFAFAQTSILLDRQIVGTVLGILQPASQSDIFRFLQEVGKDASAKHGPHAKPIIPPSSKDLATVIGGLVKENLTIQVQTITTIRYSLTSKGNKFIGTKLARLRDTTRLFLLRGPRRFKVASSRETENGRMGGASPSHDIRSIIEGTSSPQSSTGANVTAFPRKAGTPAFLAVFNSGSLTFPRDTLLEYLSFNSPAQIERAGGLKDVGTRNKHLSAHGLGLCLGVSDSLLWSLSRKTKNHYRVFELTKKSGGKRTIHAPKTFLKVTQRFILDFVLNREIPHPAVHSFLGSDKYNPPRSPITNAMQHQGSNYVASVDIKNFFGSIQPTSVKQVFEGLGELPLASDAVRLATDLCTFEDALPQGAPTSAYLSNLVLLEFDKKMEAISRKLNLNYTRYADDITFSGEFRRSTAFAISACIQTLDERSFQINSSKTRILSRRTQQRITGLVVNDKVLPPRKLRKKVRAMFHKASQDPAVLAKTKKVLRGYLSYFASISGYPANEINRYSDILKGGKP